jgi:uncharacterized membrane protein
MTTYPRARAVHLVSVIGMIMLIAITLTPSLGMLTASTRGLLL